MTLNYYPFQAIYNQFFVFLFIDVLRNAASTLSKIILILSIFVYVRSALSDFEDLYRDFKSVTFSSCQEVTSSCKEDNGNKDLEVILKTPPYEPLYIETTDGEASIPRRVFYDITKAFIPYKKEVFATLTRLALTFAVIAIIFSLIQKFKIFDEFSDIGDTFLTMGTVMLPTLLGVSKSAPHQGLRDQRRDAKIKTWLNKITTTHKVDVDLTKPTPRIVSTS